VHVSKNSTPFVPVSQSLADESMPIEEGTLYPLLRRLELLGQVLPQALGFDPLRGGEDRRGWGRERTGAWLPVPDGYRKDGVGIGRVGEVGD
jgi:hypothetical protein